MSTHSYSRCWLHLIWETLRREPMLDKRAAAKASINLSEYSLEKGIYMKINYCNTDHTHALIDLPTNLHRAGHSPAKGKLITLDQPESVGERKIRLGAWLRSILSLTLRY